MSHIEFNCAHTNQLPVGGSSVNAWCPDCGAFGTWQPATLKYDWTRPTDQLFTRSLMRLLEATHPDPSMPIDAQRTWWYDYLVGAKNLAEHHGIEWELFDR